MKSRAMKFVGGFLLFASAVYGGPVVARVYWGQDRAGWIDEPDRKQVSAVATDQPVKIDGVLNEVAWKQAAPLDDFLWLRRAIQQNIQKFANQAIGDVGAVPPTQKTVAGVLYDSNALYFGVECFEKDMKNIKMAEDNNSSFLWKDDCVEIFLDPTCSGSSYYHFVANAAGKTGRPRMSAPQQSDNTWQAAVTRTNDRWILEARIPFATLGVKPWRGSTWQLNIGREEQPLQEISSWSEMLVTFHEPSRFGRLIFGFENKIRMNLRVPSQYGVGVNKVAVRLTRQDASPASEPYYLTSSSGTTEWQRVEVKWNADQQCCTWLAIPLAASEAPTVLISLVDSKGQSVLSRPLEVRAPEKVLAFGPEIITLFDDEQTIRVEVRVNLAQQELANATLAIVGPTGREEIKLKNGSAVLDLLTGKTVAGTRVTFGFVLNSEHSKEGKIPLTIPVLESPF